MQVRCYSESSDNKPTTDTKFRGLQSTEEERAQRPSKHEILNVAEHDLEGRLWCGDRKTLLLPNLSIQLSAFGLLLCQAQFDIAQSTSASQCTQCTVCCLGFCSALPDDEESEECWNAYQYYEDKRVCLTTHVLAAARSHAQ